MQTIDDLLRDLNIDADYTENENGSFTIDLVDSNEYSRYYSKIDKSEDFEEDEEASQVTAETSSIQFINDDYILTLIANWDEPEEYKLVIRKIDKKRD